LTKREQTQLKIIYVYFFAFVLFLHAFASYEIEIRYETSLNKI